MAKRVSLYVFDKTEKPLKERPIELAALKYMVYTHAASATSNNVQHQDLTSHASLLASLNQLKAGNLSKAT